MNIMIVCPKDARTFIGACFVADCIRQVTGLGGPEKKLKVLVSAFVMASTVWSLSCMLLFSAHGACPP